MTLNDKVAVILKEIRDAKNISQAAFATTIAMSASAYSRIENGEVQITLNVLEKISENFDIPIQELMDISNHQVNNFNHNQFCPIYDGVLNINLNADEITDILGLLNARKSSK